MDYLPITMLALVVVFFSARRAARRIKEQRVALRPVPPVLPADHVPCVVNTIGVCLTEFALAALSLVVTLALAQAVLTTTAAAPTVGAAVEKIAYTATFGVFAIALLTFLLSRGIKLALVGLLLVIGGTGLMMLLVTSGGEQWPRILAFACACGGVPTLVVALLRL